MPARSSKIGKKIKELRDALWEDLKEDELWDRHDTAGFITIPRTLPLVANIIDKLTKGSPAGGVYMELWARAHDQMYVSLSKADEIAFFSGLSGQRARRTLHNRLKHLRELGFIRTASGPSGEFSHAVIINPHIVLKRLMDKKYSGLQEASYNALLERGHEIGATDINKDPRENESDPTKAT